MACDLQFTHRSGMKIKGFTKIAEVNPKLCEEMFGCKKAYVGFSGNADVWSNVVVWLDNPEDKPPKCRGLEMLLLTDKGHIYHGTNLTNWMRLNEEFFSIGAGMQYAMTAMALGKSPKEAVLVASKYDPSTGMGAKEYKV